MIQKNYVRAYIAPFFFSVLVILFWIIFRRDSMWWFPILIIIIFSINYGLFKAGDIYNNKKL